MVLNLDEKGELLLGLLVGSALKHALLGPWLRSQRDRKFEKVGEVTHLYCYPVKSCQPIEWTEAAVSPRGITHNGISDRHWMVANSKNQFVSQRTKPTMALIEVKDVGEYLQIDAPGMPSLQLPKRFGFQKTDILPCTVNGGQRLEGVDCGDAAASWICKYLKDDGLRFIAFMDDLTGKDCTSLKKPWSTQAIQGDVSAYSDYCPYMLMNEASVTALNERLEDKVTVKNFRPNVLINGTTAFDEDTWEEIRIGDTVRMRVIDPCTRCLMTTVNPETGVKSPVEEPLKTLRTFRCFPGYGLSPWFGVDAAADVLGTIKVGDPVYVIRKRDT